MSEIFLKIGEYDWVATRLTPRKYYPPKFKEVDQSRPLLNSDVNPKPFKILYLPGVEGLGVEIGRYKGEKTLLIRLAHPTPFVDSLRRFANSKLAVWNDAFNTWDIPILSQDKLSAIKEVWGIIEEAYLELLWNSIIELHWRWNIPDKAFSVLNVKLLKLNSFWDGAELEYEFTKPTLVYSGLLRKEIEEKSLFSFQSLYKTAWRPKSTEAINKLSVNWLRHECSCYHVLLKTNREYKRVFADVNNAIALAYPWLQTEAKRQVNLKSQT